MRVAPRLTPANHDLSVTSARPYLKQVQRYIAKRYIAISGASAAAQIAAFPRCVITGSDAGWREAAVPRQMSSPSYRRQVGERRGRLAGGIGGKSGEGRRRRPGHAVQRLGGFGEGLVVRDLGPAA
jgi:hypothetical protein